MKKEDGLDQPRQTLVFYKVLTLYRLLRSNMFMPVIFPHTFTHQLILVTER